jgi:hypothetical protein
LVELLGQFRPVFQPQSQIILWGRGLGLATLARSFKDIIGADIARGERRVFFRRGDRDEPLGAHLRRFCGIAGHDDPIRDDIRPSRRLLPGEPLQFKPNRSVIVIMVVANARQISGVGLAYREAGPVGQVILTKPKRYPLIEPYNLFYIVQQTNELLTNVGQNRSPRKAARTIITARNTTQCNQNP